MTQVRPERGPVAPPSGELIGDGLVLRLIKIWPAIPEKHWALAWQFCIESSEGHALGSISLRLGDSEHLRFYAGHIGYSVHEAHRGKRVATRSVRLLLPLAKDRGINPLWITCNPENLASRRTCELAGGTFVEIVDVPPDNEHYKKGDVRKCRYRFDL